MNTVKQSGNSTLKWIFLGLAFIVFVIILSSGINSCNRKKAEKEAKAKIEAESSQKSTSSSQQKPLHWVIEERRTILLTSEYGIENYVPEGKGISFENSTDTYCVINGSDNEVCGGKGEEISSKLPKDSRANSKLRFKLRDSTTGENSKPTIELVVWKLE